MSKIYDTIYSLTIDQITIEKKLFKIVEKEEIMFRVISLNDQFLFAEEIATGCIFPCYILRRDKEDQTKTFLTYSNLILGRYYLFAATHSKEKFGSVTFDEELQAKVAYRPSIQEINEYLESKERDPNFYSRMNEYEMANEYLCDIKIIKEKIYKLKGCFVPFQYIPACDIKNIKDFSFDLSAQEELCHAIGRDEEIERVIESAVIKGKSILLIGEAGSGKTAIVEELAREIKYGTNEWLADKMIVSINANSLVVSTRFRGEFETKMNKLVEFARNNKGKVILFIDEVHALKGLGSVDENDNNDGMNILKPYLSNRDIVVIGATTRQEYVKNIVPDEAFASRFDKINVKELPFSFKIDILLEFLEYLREKYDVDYYFNDPQAFITRVLGLTDIKHQVSFEEARISHIRLAKDILEDAFVHAKYKKRDSIEEADVMEAITKCDRISTVIRRREAVALQSVLSGAISVESKTAGKIIPFERVRK